MPKQKKKEEKYLPTILCVLYVNVATLHRFRLMCELISILNFRFVYMTNFPKSNKGIRKCKYVIANTKNNERKPKINGEKKKKQSCQSKHVFNPICQKTFFDCVTALNSQIYFLLL